MKNINFKKWLPYIGAIAFFLLLTITYFSPVFFEGKDLPQSDIISAVGMVKDIDDFHKQTGENSQWSNAMFSGMPYTGKYADPPTNIFSSIIKFLRLGMPPLHAAAAFFYLIGFFIFLISFRINPLLAILGSVAYAFASYNFIIIEVGHVNKCYAMAFIAPILGGLIFCFNRKYILGGIIVLLSVGFQIASYHVQVTYYTMLMCVLVGCFYLVYAIKDKWLPQFFKAVGILIIAVGISIIPNMANIYPTYDYGKVTMRGGSELSIRPEHEQSNQKVNDSGLEKDYAFAWSYGKMETFTLLIPDLYGGGHDVIGPNSKTAKELQAAGANLEYLPTYWGDQPFTAGPVYAGAIVCFLFVLGLFIVKGKEKWILLGITILSFFLAWGKNLAFFNDFLFYHLPLFNGFRSPNMALMIAGVSMPFLGILALKEIFSKSINKEEIFKKVKISFYITGGLCVLFIACAALSIFDFTSQHIIDSVNHLTADDSFKAQLLNAGFPDSSVNQILNILIDHRKSMLISDAFRSLIFIILAFGTLYLYFKGKLKNIYYVIGILIVLVLVDMWTVDKRYLNNDNFKPKRQATTVNPTAADLFIMEDKDPNYRVFNASVNTFNDATTSYFHKSVGGYSAIKLRRYQDLIDFYMSRNFEPKVLNMLNTRYFITPNGQVQQNSDAYGNAWFVNDFKIVKNADEEILALKDINPRYTAVIDERFGDFVKNLQITKDTLATIQLTEYAPNHLVYKTHASTEQLAVFSEVFYDKYWKVFIDGKETKHFRADYILRAMKIPAGDHTIEFKAESEIVNASYTISLWGSILVGIILIGGIVYWVIISKKKRGNFLQ